MSELAAPANTHRVPILFGSPRRQQMLLALAGDEGYESCAGLALPLYQSGLVARTSAGKFFLDQRHPAFGELWSTLAAIGKPRFRNGIFDFADRPLEIDRDRPLGHENRLAFRALFFAAQAKSDSLDVSLLRTAMPDASLPEIRRACTILARLGVFEEVAGGVRFTARIPAAYVRMIVQTGAHLALFDERYRCELDLAKGRRPFAFMAPEDGMPNLFGTDTRLSHLIALAREGPLHLSDLRRITGAQSLAFESRDNAPLGRGSLVRYWETDAGPAAMLDPDFPLAHELRLLLLRLGTFRRLPPLYARLPVPEPPPRRVWNGDKYALFGGEIATSILMTIGSLGWTFESLCVNATPGCHRENIKKMLQRLEREGLVSSDRAPRPGFDARIVRLSTSFPAYAEMDRLLRRCVELWPEFDRRTRGAFASLPKKTHVHLRNRGLIDSELPLDVVRQSTSPDADAAERNRCIDEYWLLAASIGKLPSSADLMSKNSNLCRRIHRYWGGMSAFRIDAGAKAPPSGSREVLHPLLRSRCLDEYRVLSERLGYNPNVSDLIRECESGLYERIKLAWGTFPAFVSEMQPALSRQRRDPNRSVEAMKADSIARYNAIQARLGHAPTSSELDVGLKKQIYKTWGSFRSFLSETNTVTNCPIQVFESMDARRAHCLEQYALMQEQLGHAPSSAEIQRSSPGLYVHIKNAWGGFPQFCIETGLRAPRITKKPAPRRHRAKAIGTST